MANDDITWVRPEHRAASAAWRKYRDFCKGAEAVKAAGNKYLPYLDPTDKSTRNRKRNEDYLSRAVFYAIAGNTKIGMLGMAYRKDPTFNGPEKLNYLLDNADGAGTSIYQQSQLVAENVLEVAREGLYVDYAEASDEAIILRYNPNTGNYVNLIKGTWYTGEWSFGGARGGGANFDNVTLNLKGSNQEGMVTWVFHSNGAATGNWVTASDERIKENVTVIANPLMKMQQLRGVEWDRLDTPAHGYGFIAQEVEKAFPDAVKSYGKTTLRNGTEIEDVKSVDTFGVAAALHHEAILALMVKVENLERQLGIS